jgi:hypothetical protein
MDELAAELPYRMPGFLEHPRVPYAVRHSRAPVVIVASRPPAEQLAAPVSHRLGHAATIWPGIGESELKQALATVGDVAILTIRSGCRASRHAQGACHAA